jgi:hypothetical protein
LCEEYAHRAGTAAAYREAAGITDPRQAASPGPHRGNAELEDMRQATIRALEIRDEADIIRGMSRGDLEARILDAERAQVTAPPDVSAQLRLTAQAEADAWQQAAEAATKHDHAQPTSAQTLASEIATKRQQLEAVNTRYEEWSSATKGIRETAAKARAELERRGVAQPPAEQSERGNEPPTMTGWWQQFEADLTAAERALERQRQTTIAAGASWPPQRMPQHEQELQACPAADVEPEGRSARLSELLSLAADATERLAARNVEQGAKAEYAARIEREARIEPGPTLQAQAQDQAEAEL